MACGRCGQIRVGGVRRGQSSVIQLILSPAALPTQWISSWALSIHCSEAGETVGESGVRTGEDIEEKSLGSDAAR